MLEIFDSVSCRSTLSALAAWLEAAGIVSNVGYLMKEQIIKEVNKTHIAFYTLSQGVLILNDGVSMQTCIETEIISANQCWTTFTCCI